jgi:hypothetical protein
VTRYLAMGGAHHWRHFALEALTEHGAHHSNSSSVQAQGRAAGIERRKHARGLQAKPTCLMSPFLRGPRQMTASSGFGSMKPMDMTPRLSSTYTGDHPCRSGNPV